MNLLASAYADFMPASIEPATQQKPGSFAALLAGLTGSSRVGDSNWDDSGLADDIATISYEQALSAHRRMRSFDRGETLPENGPSGTRGFQRPVQSAASEKKRKSASITLRVATEEFEQLQDRAAAAQLSVSAYIRSCIFEAESLRAQVKAALVQMQAAEPSPPARGEKPPPSSRPGFIWRWIHRGRNARRDE
jgi:hypothetical protein